MMAATTSATAGGAPPRWGTGRTERIPAYVWVFLAGLGFSMFSGHSGDLGLPIALDRPLIALAVVLLLLDPHRDRLRWRAFYVVAALTVGWTALSWVSSGSLGDSYKLYALVDRIIVPLAMFPIGALIFGTPLRRLILTRAAAVLGIYLGVIGVLEYLGLYSLVLPGYVGALHDPTSTEVRAGGPWLAPEPFGMTAALALFLCVLLFRTSSSAAWRVVAALGAVGGLVGAVLSMTRSVWGAVIAAGLLIGILLPAVRRRLPLLIVIAVAVGAALLAAFPEFQEAILARLTTERSVFDRQNTYEAAWRIVQQLPLFGIGWGEFINQNILWVRQADTYPVTTVTIEVHDVFLSRAAETGVLGAVLWILCFATGPLLGLLAKPRSEDSRRWKLVGLAATVVWLIPSLTSPNPYPTPNDLIWLLWGIAARGILVELPAGSSGAQRPARPV
jgi:O-antigen ligase